MASKKSMLLGVVAVLSEAERLQGNTLKLMQATLLVCFTSSSREAAAFILFAPEAMICFWIRCQCVAIGSRSSSLPGNIMRLSKILQRDLVVMSYPC